MNKDFSSCVRQFTDDFHEWNSHLWKSLVNCLMIKNHYLHRAKYYFISHLLLYVLDWCISNEYKHQSFISSLLPRTAYFWHGSVISHKCKAPALILHVQIGAKLIITREKILHEYWSGVTCYSLCSVNNPMWMLIVSTEWDHLCGHSMYLWITCCKYHRSWSNKDHHTHLTERFSLTEEPWVNFLSSVIFWVF